MNTDERRFLVVLSLVFVGFLTGLGLLLFILATGL